MSHLLNISRHLPLVPAKPSRMIDLLSFRVLSFGITKQKLFNYIVWNSDMKQTQQG